MKLPRTAAQLIAELEDAASGAQKSGILVALPNGSFRFILASDPERLDTLWRLMDGGWEPVCIIRDQLSDCVLPGEVLGVEIQAVMFDGDEEWDERTERFVAAVMEAIRRDAIERGEKAGPLEIGG